MQIYQNRLYIAQGTYIYLTDCSYLELKKLKTIY